MYRDKKPHEFKIGDLIINKTAKVLFSSDINVLYYGLFFVQVKVDEVFIITEISSAHVTVITECGDVGWQSAHHFEILQKANDT